MNRNWYNENRFPNANYINYLRQLVSESELIAEVECSAQVWSVFHYESIGYLPTFAIIRLMKNLRGANNNDFYLWLLTKCLNHSIHYSFQNNEIEIFENNVLDPELPTIGIGRLNHEMQLYGKNDGSLNIFLNQVFNCLTDGEINRPVPPNKWQPHTLFIKTRNWKKQAKSIMDQSMKILIIRCPAVEKFKQVILNLSNLTVLDLGNNEIMYIPTAFGNLQLRELYLPNNSIGTSRKWKWLTGKKICSTLRILDLSNNEIKSCPSSIGRLNLIALDLSDNYMETFPHSVGRMYNLRCLRLARNRLQVVPEALFRIPIKYLDLSGNRLDIIPNKISQPAPADSENVFSLTKIASNCVINNRIYGAEGTPEAVEELLDEFKRCFCGNPANDKIFHVRRVNCRRLFPVVIYHGSRIFGVSTVFYCCSAECFNTVPR